MRRLNGSTLIEALLMIPLFLMMVLGFVDLSRWELERLSLWQHARALVRSAAINNQTPDSLQSQIRSQLSAAGLANVAVRVKVVSLLENIEKNSHRKKKPVALLQITFQKPAQIVSPLFRLIHTSPRILTVSVYEAYFPSI